MNLEIWEFPDLIEREKGADRLGVRDADQTNTWQVHIGKKLDPQALGQFWSDGGRCGWVRDLLG